MIVHTGKTYYEAEKVDSLVDLLERSHRLYKDEPFVMHRETADQETIVKTYDDFYSDVDRLQQGLAARHKQGARIAVIGENSYTWMLVYLAAMNGDSMIVPLDRLLRMDEVKVLLQRAEVDTLFYDASFQSEVERVLPELPALTLAIPMLVKRAPAKERALVAERLSEGTIDKTTFMSFDALLDEGDKRIESGQRFTYAPVEREASRALLFTSGTTATSKGVLLSHKNLAADVMALAGVIRFEPGFRSLSILPLHHTFENTCGFLTVMYFGGVVCIADGLRHIQKNLLEYQVDMLIGVPALFDNFYHKIQQALIKKKKTRLVGVMRVLTRGLRKIGIDLRRKVFKEILDSLGGNLHTGIAGAAAMSPEIIRFFDDLGVRVVQGYGLTETSPVAAGCNDFVFAPGTVGHPLAGIELAIDSETPHEPGEILIRGPIVMNGYYNDEAATAEAIDDDGWLHTGDLGLIDKRGMLTITGRLKSLIVLESGKKIFPEELEALLNQHEYVKDSLVYAQADERGDIVVSAKIILDKEAIGAEEPHSISEWLQGFVKDVNRSLPQFKNVKSYFYSFTDMVRTTTLKVKRNVEISGLSELVKRHKLNWRQLIGRNIDELSQSESERQSEPSGKP